MPNSSLTRNQLVDLALATVGNTTLTAEAYTWLNNIVDRFCLDYKFSFLEKLKTGTLAANASSVGLPSDFGDVWDRHSFVLTDSNGGRIQPEIFSPEDYDLLASTTTTGTPSLVVFDLKALTWTVWPVPAVSYTYSLRYRYKPARISTDVVVEFPNDDLLVQALIIKGLQYEDDERYTTELVILQNMITRFVGGFNKSPIKRPQIRLNANRFQTPQSFR